MTATGRPHRGAADDLGETHGFIVVDAHGRHVGIVERPVYRRVSDIPDALEVHVGRLARRHRLIPTDAVEVVDARTRVVGLRVDRDALYGLP
jgi:hypothetical protein